MPASGPVAAEYPAAHPTPKSSLLDRPSLLHRLRQALARLLSGQMEGEVVLRPSARPSPKRVPGTQKPPPPEGRRGSCRSEGRQAQNYSSSNTALSMPVSS